MDKQHLNNAAKFGSELIRTGDLDPVYLILHKAKVDTALRKRIFLAYSCLYHLGSAVEIATSSKFYHTLWEAAENNCYLRGTERRHWRGTHATNCVAHFVALNRTPEEIVNDWAQGYTFHQVAKVVESYVGYGPWMSFKIADMLERVFGYGISFEDCELFLYKEPRAGAQLISGQDFVSKDSIRAVVNALLDHKRLRDLKAPPRYDRPLNIQEIETILCKYKSHVKGHYWVGKDIAEVNHAIAWKNNQILVDALYRASLVLPEEAHG